MEKNHFLHIHIFVKWFFFHSEFIDSSLLVVLYFMECTKVPRPIQIRSKGSKESQKNSKMFHAPNHNIIFALAIAYIFILYRFVSATPLVMEFILEQFLFPFHFLRAYQIHTYTKCEAKLVTSCYIIWLLLYSSVNIVNLKLHLFYIVTILPVVWNISNLPQKYSFKWLLWISTIFIVIACAMCITIDLLIESYNLLKN